jgi:cyclic beta-1,2-glucan synthetase
MKFPVPPRRSASPKEQPKLTRYKRRIAGESMGESLTWHHQEAAPESAVRKRVSLGYYSSSIAVLALLLATPIVILVCIARPSAVVVMLATVAAGIASSAAAVELINQFFHTQHKPVSLPRLCLDSGIPAELKTLIIIQAMLIDRDTIIELSARLEQHFVSNHEGNLLFGLVTDFVDADARYLHTDDALSQVARLEIERLNSRHDARFFIFHRSREWNAIDRVWMGRERKRGKIEDLNALLVECNSTPFSLIVGPREQLAGVRYVITLDVDNELLPGVAKELIAIMAHPANRPVVDPVKRIVRHGYGVLQPLPSIVLRGGEHSFWQLLAATERDRDQPRGELFQDFFGNGSYYGKGIYELATWHSVIGHRFPSNAILSHDLLEGAYVGSAIAADVTLPELHPDSYLSDLKRRHRWARGDWQLLPWLAPMVPAGNGGRERNPLGCLDKWKIADNVRRTMIAPAFFTAFVSIWLWCKHPALATAWIVFLFYLPALAPLAQRVFPKAGYAECNSLACHVSARSLRMHTLALALLVQESVNATDAIVRTCWRLYVTRRRLLAWEPSARVSARWLGICGCFRMMWHSPGISLFLMFVVLARTTDPFCAVPLATLWLAAPAIAWWTGQQGPRQKSDGCSTRK